MAIAFKKKKLWKVLLHALHTEKVKNLFLSDIALILHIRIGRLKRKGNCIKMYSFLSFIYFNFCAPYLQCHFVFIELLKFY